MLDVLVLPLALLVPPIVLTEVLLLAQTVVQAVV
jgi:hypothetical protein